MVIGLFGQAAGAKTNLVSTPSFHLAVPHSGFAGRPARREDNMAAQSVLTLQLMLEGFVMDEEMKVGRYRITTSGGGIFGGVGYMILLDTQTGRSWRWSLTANTSEWVPISFAGDAPAAPASN
jgi:hypothetical protein